MTQEEKAKAYDKAIERAMYWRKNPTIWSSDDICQKLFPELKESEDERISKVLIELVEEYKESSTYGGFGGLKWDKLIAWLEKQCEQKPNFSSHSAPVPQQSAHNAPQQPVPQSPQPTDDATF